MSHTEDGEQDWRIAPVPSRSLRREQDGQLALTFQIVRHRKHVALAPLLLTAAEAEKLHADLCYALDKEPAPDDAPECRKPVQYSGSRDRF
ncbi:hypothetical protein [Streptomyces sp. NPDC088400]|uniref:hypothetical protein n=1 Tax=Streptomyces sp. NPDC088400 TaxID=3365861 RepID=UPI0037FFF736